MLGELLKANPLGAPKRLDSTPLLGFPTYDTANMFTLGLTAEF